MSVLSQAQKSTIAEAIIAKIHKPNLNTFFGRLAVHSLVNEIDTLLSSSLTPELSQILSSPENGITEEETAQLQSILPTYLLKNVHNIFLQSVLSQIIDIVVGILIQALQVGSQLN